MNDELRNYALDQMHHRCDRSAPTRFSLKAG